MGNIHELWEKFYERRTIGKARVRETTPDSERQCPVLRVFNAAGRDVVRCNCP